MAVRLFKKYSRWTLTPTTIRSRSISSRIREEILSRKRHTVMRLSLVEKRLFFYARSKIHLLSEISFSRRLLW